MNRHKKLKKAEEKKYFPKQHKRSAPNHTPEEIEEKMPGKISRQPMITMRGSRWIHIENYLSIAVFENEAVKILGKDWVLLIKGRRLRIAYFTEDDILICGRIEQVRFL